MKLFKLGAKRDQTRHRTQKDARLHLLRGMPASPAKASLEAFEFRPVLDQNATSSCTGHGTAQLIYTAMGAAGTPILWCPSPRGIYANTRRIELAAETPPGLPLPGLTDQGTAPGDIMTAVSTWGVRAMSFPSPLGQVSDCDASNVDADPTLGELEGEGATLIVGEYRIDETAQDVVEQMRQTLAFAQGGKGAPVGVGAFVDTAVMNWSAGDPPLQSVNLGDNQGGGHWFAVTSYRTDSDGATIFRAVNSWSEGYGDLGHFEFTGAWLRQAASDIYPFPVTRKVA